MKYLLCRPRGGLNDALNQIELCWRYAYKHNRFLIIDTEYLVSSGISISFSKLFDTIEPIANVALELSPELLENLNKIDTYPKSCQGRLDKYKTRWDSECFNLVDRDNGVQLSFDFNKYYEEELLLHDQFGGGYIGINCLARLKLTNKFRCDVISRLAPLLEEKYLAVLVRHTDYQTNYRIFFDQIYDKSINQRLLICSDSIEVIVYAKVFFDQSEVISISEPPETNGIGLSTFAAFHCNDEQRYELMVNAMSDLIALATSTEIIFSLLESGKFSNASVHLPDFSAYAEIIKNNQSLTIGVNGFSGFAVLADGLRNNSALINKLLSNESLHMDDLSGIPPIS